jgi:hypothetical protein
MWNNLKTPVLPDYEEEDCEACKLWAMHNTI